MVKNIEWWRTTAQHMWRTYFALRRQQDDSAREQAPPPAMSGADARIYETCDKIFSTNFVKADQDILKMYFTSRWGDDLYAVEDYSLKHNIPVKVIWIVIRRANREAMVAIGLLDRKEGTEDGRYAGD